MLCFGKIRKQLRRIADAIIDASDIGTDVAKLSQDVKRIANVAEYWMRREMWSERGRPAGIVSMSVSTTIEENGMAVSNVSVELLPAKPEAVSQVVTVAVAGYITAEIVVPASENVARFAVAQGSEINLTVASRDAAGNTSSPFVVAPFVAVDTEAPDSPDGIGAISSNDLDVVATGFVELVPEAI